MRDSNEEAVTEEVRDGGTMEASDDGATATAEAIDRPVAGRQTRSRVVASAWAVVVAGLSIFLAFGSVTLEAGSRRGRSQRVVEVWHRFLDDLPEGGNATLLRVVVVGLIAVVLLGSTLGFWLAMTAADDGASRPLVDGAGGT